MDFPIHDLDLSSYIRDRSGQMSNHYQLYAVSNHYGSMGGGHYTAYVYVSVLFPADLVCYSLHALSPLSKHSACA